METEEERRIRRKMRIEEMKREKRRTELLRKWGVAAACVAVLAVGFGVGRAMFHSGDGEAAQKENGDVQILSLGDLENGKEAGAGVAGNETGANQGSPGESEAGGDQGSPEGAGAGADQGSPGESEAGAEQGSPEGAGAGAEQGSSGESEAGGDQGSPEGAGAGAEQEGLGGSGAASGREQRNRKGTQVEALSERTRIMGPLVYGKGNSRMGNVEFPEDGEGTPMSSPQDADVPLEGALAGKTPVFEAHDGETTAEFDETIISEYGVLIDVEDGMVLAQKAAHERMNPASMTKILTVLVAAEHLTEADLDATVPITIDITDYCFVNECSITGYELDEEVPVRDLFYGTILPSGADSSLALAIYVAGSQEAFVDMMNAKVEELGLAETTHFTNCVGLYDEAHYTTAYDMAVILKAAADNEFCREILSAHTYNTTATEQHPEGMLISNWFLRRIEDKDTHGEVLCGKTGFVDQSGSCAASLARGNNGREYLCVTANSTSSWRCIYDQVELYQNFITE